MKNNTTFRTILLGVFILVVSSSMSFAKSYRYSKEYEVTKKYKASEGVITNLNVQYTDLEILRNNTSNEIYLICKVELKSNNESYVNNPWNYITIDHSMSSNIFDLKIKYNNEKSNNRSSNLKIKCYLYLPDNYTADIICQFSDLEINAPTNKPLKLIAQHSDVELNTPFTNIRLTAQYSDIEAKRIDYIDAKVQYGELNVEVLGEAKYELQYSELEVDDLRGSVTGTFQYSEAEVVCSSSSTGFDCGLQYSELKLSFNNYIPNISGRVKSSFSEIKASSLEFISSSANNLGNNSKVDCEIRSKNFSSGSDVFTLKLNAAYSTITVK